MKTIEVNGHRVETDGITVWVNSPEINVGRYGPRAVDVHLKPELQMKGDHCFDCFKRTVFPADDWKRFCKGMMIVHGVKVPDDFEPQTIYEYAGFRYRVVQDDRSNVSMVPVPGQHSAAEKDKHRCAAREQYLEDRSR